MNIGFVTYYSKEIVEFAGKAGFDCLEVSVRKGSSLDLDRLKEKDLEAVLEDFRSNGVKIGTLTCSTNHLEGDPSKRRENNAYFNKAIKLCRKFGTDILTTNAWGDKSKTPSENIGTYKEVFTEYAKAAADEGVRIALENCPHWLGYPMTIGNISFSPEMWDALFEAVPSKAVGLEFDPSHLFWMGIDCVKAVRDYGERIYAFHAKDTEIIKEKRDRYGIAGKQIGKESEWDSGWWRYRLPGLGMIDWKGVFNALYDIDFTGPLIIEHEDPVFGGDRSENGLDLGPKTETGLKLGLRYLRQFML